MDKYLTCSKCGAVGVTLVGAGDKQHRTYSCQDIHYCTRRQLKRKGKLCSIRTCLNEAKYSCSCGVELCEAHSMVPQHATHLKTSQMLTPSTPLPTSTPKTIRT